MHLPPPPPLAAGARNGSNLRVRQSLDAHGPISMLEDDFDIGYKFRAKKVVFTAGRLRGKESHVCLRRMRPLPDLRVDLYRLVQGLSGYCRKTRLTQIAGKEPGSESPGRRSDHGDGISCTAVSIDVFVASRKVTLDKWRCSHYW